MKRLALFFFGSLLVALTSSEEASQTEAQKRMDEYRQDIIDLQKPNAPCWNWEYCSPLSFGRLSSFRETYLGMHTGLLELGEEDRTRDELALRGQYSLKFSLYDNWCTSRDLLFVQDETTGKAQFDFFSDARLNCLIEKSTTNQPYYEWFFGMTGQFDFYYLTRESDPVINRVSNPGIYWRRYLAADPFERVPSNELIIGLEHRSNGQVRDQYLAGEPVADVVEDATQAYAEGDISTLDTLGQSANYLSVTWSQDFIQTGNDMNIGYSVTGKIYLDDYGQQSWDEGNEQLGFSGYDIIYASAKARWLPRTLIAELSMRFGSEIASNQKSFSDTVATEFTLTKLIYGLPWQVRFHSGPFEYLAAYSVPSTSVTVGLSLNSFDLGS